MSGPFKVGDLVECIDGGKSRNVHAPPLSTGEIYTVLEIWPFRGIGPGIEIDKVPLFNATQRWVWNAGRFRLVRRPGDHADFLASLTREPAEGLDVDGERAREAVEAWRAAYPAIAGAWRLTTKPPR